MGNPRSKNLMAISVLALVCACSPGADPTGATASITPGPTQAEESTLPITVPGTTLGWSSTGVWLQAGESYILEASGEVNTWPNCEDTKVEAGYAELDCAQVPAGPEGTDAFAVAAEGEGYPYPGGPIAALVVRVGEGEAILVGMGGTFVADATGFLQFAINDVTTVWDNEGEFVVSVVVHLVTYPEITKGSWSDTNFVLKAGDEFAISATGAINMWPNCEETKEEQGFPGFDCSLTSAVGPTGTDAFAPGREDYPLPGENTLALVARVGNGPVFLVGEGGAFTTDVGGPLLLATNDTGYWKQDDQGTFVVVISKEETGDGVYLPGTYDGWIETGISVDSGDSVGITATGIVDVWPLCEIEKEGVGVPDIDCSMMRTGPSGFTGGNPPPDDHPLPLPDAPTGALLGRWGDEAPFVIGEGGEYVAEADGILRLRINDSYGIGDNEGGYLAIITIEE
ncbi:MAG: hypothetical protein JW722_00735 [Demequinaceae bacterium]|nr:hypothetical protein [Demequinaceae bacterium]